MNSFVPYIRWWFALILSAFGVGNCESASWPQFLGPHRNGIYDGTPLTKSWPKEGPIRLWSREVGQGFSGPVVEGESLVLNHRVGDLDRVECMDASTGKTLWKHDLSARYVDDFGFDEGPRATPSIASGFVVTVSADGWIRCLKLSDGTLTWEVDSRTKWGARKGFFGLAPSPLVDGSQVIVDIGGSDGHSIVALDLATGRSRWQIGDDEASYASPITAVLKGEKRILVLTREALMSLDSLKGTLSFRHPWRPQMQASVSAATPLVMGDQILLTASYDTGATLLDCGGETPKVLWEKQDVLSSHYATPVLREGYLYGFDGRQERGCSLRCVEWKSGKVMWTEDRFGAGTLILAEDELVVLSEKGELAIVEASPKGFHVNRRSQVIPFLARAHPALANGHLFARSKDKLFCFDLTR